MWYVAGNNVFVSNGKITTAAFDPGAFESALVTCSYNGYSKDAFYSDGFEYQTRVYVENPAAVTDSKLTSTQKTRTYNLTIKTGTAYVIQMKGMIQPAIWRSKNNNIAFVDENGIVYGRSSGKTSLQMKVNGITHTINVVVN